MNEIKKMKQGMTYSKKEKIIILNVFKYFRQEYPDKCVTEIVKKTAKATGCSEKSIFQFRKEETSVEGFKEPCRNKVRKYININSRDIKYDNSVRQTIRNVIYELRCRNVVPSLSTILKTLNNRSDVPKFSLMTLRRLMFDMGFYYQRDGNKCTLVENPDMRLIKDTNDHTHCNDFNVRQRENSKSLEESNINISENVIRNTSQELIKEQFNINVTQDLLHKNHSLDINKIQTQDINIQHPVRIPDEVNRPVVIPHDPNRLHTPVYQYHSTFPCAPSVPIWMHGIIKR